MKTFGKSIRVYLLVCVLLVGLYVLYLFYHPAKPPSETTAQGLDTSDFSTQAIPRHIEALKSNDAAVRQKAAKALWQIVPGTRESITALIAAAKDADPAVREMAAKALGPSSEGSLEAVPTLLAALKDQEAGVRAEAGH